jgi:hypothetical protein
MKKRSRDQSSTGATPGSPSSAILEGGRGGVTLQGEYSSSNDKISSSTDTTEVRRWKEARILEDVASPPPTSPDPIRLDWYTNRYKEILEQIMMVQPIKSWPVSLIRLLTNYLSVQSMYVFCWFYRGSRESSQQHPNLIVGGFDDGDVDSVMLGSDGSDYEPLDDVFIMTPSISTQWYTLPKMPMALHGHSAVVLDDFILIVGGKFPVHLIATK